MNPNSSLTYHEHAAMEATDRSPIEAALESLDEAQRAAEKALAVLIDRLAAVTQPEEMVPLDSIAGEKSGFPQSPVLRRINNAAEELRSLADRTRRLTERLDV